MGQGLPAGLTQKIDGPCPKELPLLTLRNKAAPTSF